VTCPCAIGIATPLAFDITLARLRKSGVFVRSHALLDKLRRVRTVVFDKTGTLTSGGLEAEALRSPAGRDLDVLFTMASQSSHPKSRAIVAALEGSDHSFLAELTVEDVPGQGLLVRDGATTWRLGSQAFVCGENAGSDEGVTCLARDGQIVACFAFDEEFLAGAAAELAALAARGIEVWLLSGDKSAKVRRAAELLGLPESRALGELAPEQKAQRLAALDHRDTMMVGDGINDGPAFAAAFTCGTPALDRPVMPSRADFCFSGASAGRVERLFAVSDRFWRVVRTNLRLSLTYNLCAVALCASGVMTPLLCAVLMPVSSLGLIAHTSLRLSRA
jgi:Cu2+-exporting ATPase